EGAAGPLRRGGAVDPGGGEGGPGGGPERTAHDPRPPPRRGGRREAAGGALATAIRVTQEEIPQLGERDLSRSRDRQASVVLMIAAAISMLLWFPLGLVLGLVAM